MAAFLANRFVRHDAFRQGELFFAIGVEIRERGGKRRTPAGSGVEGPPGAAFRGGQPVPQPLARKGAPLALPSGGG